jgi:beta-lactamase class A
MVAHAIMRASPGLGKRRPIVCDPPGTKGETIMADALQKIAALLDASGIETGFAAVAVERGIEIAVNGESLFPTASTFKVPVMVEVYAQARAGKFKITDRHPFEDRLRVIGSGVMQTLAAGLQPTIRDLMMLMNIVSDNTATDVLCDLVGLDHVQARMRALGLEDIHTPLPCRGLFIKGWNLPADVTFAGLKAASKASPMSFTSAAFARDGTNNVCSAVAMARLMAMIQQHEAAPAEDCADMIAILENQHYQDRVPRFLPLGSVANKTGSLRGLRNDVGLIRRGPGDTIAYGLFTMDTTEHPHGNSRALVEANIRIGTMMGEVGQVLWDDFGK